jgi:hypothetical protein
MSENTNDNSGSSEAEHLASFFIYSFFVYPITNYIVSPQRKYPRWKAVLYAIIFLAGVSYLVLVRFPIFSSYFIHVLCY